MSTWTCPFCQHDQAVTEPKSYAHFVRLGLQDIAYGDVGVEIRALGCANHKCRMFEVWIDVAPFQPGRGGKARTIGSRLFSGRVVPQGETRVLADFIPLSIRQDYGEACLIRELSPRASAALSRRCLGAMITDFCQMSRPSAGLSEDILALATTVRAGAAPPGVSVESIEALLSVVNQIDIAAHMHPDADPIGPVDPGEAQALIVLIEALIDGWYNERHRRTETFAKVTGAGKTVAPTVEAEIEPSRTTNARLDRAHTQLADDRARHRTAQRPTALPDGQGDG
jgi:hypothetical protein